MKQPTMKDVAKLAGVSQPTVSHVINGTASISAIVTRKVNEAIRELGYIPPAATRSDQTNRSNLIGLIVPDVSIRFYAQLVKKIEITLRKKGYMVFLCNTFYSEQLERRYVETLIQHKVMGVISASNLMSNQSYYLLKNNNIPVALLDTTQEVEWAHNVNVDNYRVAKMAVSHLYNIGTKNICYVSEPLRADVLKNRYEYFKQTLAEFGLKYDHNICFIAQNRYENDNKMKMGYNIGANILLHSKIDAVFASSDEFAFGVMQRLKEHDVGIPKDIAIMGCDNDPFSKLMSPSLTTVWQPINKMAETGAQGLVRIISGEAVGETIVRLDPDIIIRESTMKSSNSEFGGNA